MSNLSHDDLIERGLHQKDELLKKCERLEAQNKKLIECVSYVAQMVDDERNIPEELALGAIFLEVTDSARQCLKEIEGKQ